MLEPPAPEDRAYQPAPESPANDNLASDMSGADSPGAETKTRLLDAAEALFAEHGFSRTTLRDLTSAAQANLAAVNYHYGSKQDLLRAVMARRLVPLNRERLERIDAVLAGVADDAPPPLEGLLDAMFAPALRLRREPGGQRFMQLLGRLHAEPDRSPVKEMFFEQFQQLAQRFVPAMARALPHLDSTELNWRLHFMIGSMAHTLMCSDQLARMSQGRCDPRDVDEVLQQMIAYASGGLLAPPLADGGPG